MILLWEGKGGRVRLYKKTTKKQQQKTTNKQQSSHIWLLTQFLTFRVGFISVP